MKVIWYFRFCGKAFSLKEISFKDYDDMIKKFNKYMVGASSLY